MFRTKRIPARAVFKLQYRVNGILTMNDNEKNQETDEIKIHVKPDDAADGPEKTSAAGMDEDRALEELSNEELIERIEGLQQESRKNYDLFLRSQAEMENMKKRHQKEKGEWRLFANEKLIKELLPAVDNLQMAIEHSRREPSMEALREGLELTIKGLMQALNNAGLDEVRTQGETFDPCFHEAISMAEDASRKPGEVLQELQKGYVLNERLIRPALVIVNKGESGEQDPTGAVCEADKE